MEIEINVREDENFKFNNYKLSASEAVYGFAAWLTTREEVTTMSSKHDSIPITKLCEQFVEENKLSYPRDGWENNLIHPFGECSHGNVEEIARPAPVSNRPEPTLENKKGHEWFNGTSWGLK